MLKLNAIADKEDGWIQVVSSMVNVIPMHNPLGPSVIILLLDDCPLPSKVGIYLLHYKNIKGTVIIKIIVSSYDFIGLCATIITHVSTISKTWTNTNYSYTATQYMCRTWLYCRETCWS